MATELAKQYDPKEAQERWLRFWEERGYFHSEPDPRRKPYTIVIPPPNVTGALHMGHALNNTLQDVLIRWRRAQGFNTLYLPGTDHAGIATQAIVEKRIKEEENKTRRDLGREELIARIWKWKDQYGRRILGQLRSLGCSCDWQRTRFTLDEMCAKAVRHTFFQMFKDGLIFRGKRLVNWDAQLQTSVADDETFNETILGGFWTFRYPVKGTQEFIRFSTTRPETMLGDTAVAVHPTDPRYQHLIGKTVTIPLVGRDIPIIADGLLVDPSLGTGCVKVTPAHDFNDYACGQRHKLPMINILNPDGTINANGGPFAGLDRETARLRVTEEMEKLGFFEGREDREITMPFSDRSKSPIEPLLSDQWFVKMSDLAESALKAVETGEVRIIPERYTRNYSEWLAEKRDWCVSRQLWWGHRIPIWYAQCAEDDLKKAFGKSADVAWRWDADNKQWLICALADLPADSLGDHELRQDPDVLDTWFSSALWPHSTLGWPEKSPELAYYYPTSTLVTSRDIITLWVARMVLTGLYNVGKVPFHHVYIHPKILDGFGETMSKSKGNGIDPLDIIERYGTDALRFGMVHLATENQDSRMPVANVCPHCGILVPVKQEHLYGRTKKLNCPGCKKPFRPGGPWPADDPALPTAKQASERFDMGRNFANKLWNAARFLLLNLDGYQPGKVILDELPLEDRWILSRLAATAAAMTGHLEAFRFSDVARTLYDFTWSEFCDWYLEMSKGRLRDEQARPLAQRILVGLLDAILRLAQPIIPFVAESIWQALAEAAPQRGLPEPARAADSVVIAAWPVFPAQWQDAAMDARIGRMQNLVRGVREVRNRYDQLDPKTPLNLIVRCSASVAADFKALSPFLSLLAGVGTLQAGPAAQRPRQSATLVNPEFEAYVCLEGLIDHKVETARLETDLGKKRKHLQTTRDKLSNAAFTARAPAELVQQQRDLANDLEKQIEAIEQNLKDLHES
jgi:valyl-tRNA synthetase